MSDELPPGLTLDVVAEFHEQLLRLQSAGLRLQIDEGRSTSQSLAERLNEIMAGLVSQVGKSNQLEQVLQAAPFIPLRYRLALESWAKCDRSVEALSILRAPVKQESEGAIDLRYALLLPFIVLALVYFASFYLLQVTVPHMEGIYLQFERTAQLARALADEHPCSHAVLGAGIACADSGRWLVALHGQANLASLVAGPPTSLSLFCSFDVGSKPGCANGPHR